MTCFVELQPVFFISSDIAIILIRIGELKSHTQFLLPLMHLPVFSLNASFCNGSDFKRNVLNTTVPDFSRICKVNTCGVHGF